MALGNAWLLLAALAAPAAVVLRVIGRRRLFRDARRIALWLGVSSPGVDRNAAGIDARTILLSIGLTCCGFAAADPGGLSPDAWRSTSPDGVVVALDVSRSMTATDVRPSRLRAATDGIAAWLDSSRTTAFGLVSFAGDAVLACPLTLDRPPAKAALARADSAPVAAGSDLEAGLTAAIEVAKRRGARLVLVSDGEATSGEINRAVALAQAAGVRISAVGVGTLDGAEIPEAAEQPPRLARTATPVHRTRLSETTLQAAAAATGGLYRRLSSGDEVTAVLSGSIPAAAAPPPRTYYRVPLTIGFVLLVLEALVGVAGRASTHGR